MKSTLAIYDAMLEAKVSAAAARGVAEALERDMEAIVATKTDLQYLREQVSGEIHALKAELQALKSDLHALKAELQALKSDLHALKAELQALKSEMDSRFERLELRLTVKLGAFLAIAVGLIVTLEQLLR